MAKVVGPGKYEASTSVFERNKNVSGPIINAPTQSNSPRLRAASFNPGLLKVSAPSIPSKFLTPIIDTSRTDSQSTILVQHEFCQISRLVQDPSKVGPGTYNTQGDMASKPKLVTNWQTSSPSGIRQGVKIDTD